MRERDDSERLVDAVRHAAEQRQGLAIAGSGSKAFLGPEAAGTRLDVTGHCGVIDYQPRELVITARTGTPLTALRALLEAQGQMLPFDPPMFSGTGTLGGAVAAGLAGPGRPWYGGVRDAVLGVELVNGRGERLRFGGQVMKNVAGYDLSRLMSGAFGTLGVLLAVSLRVVPRPAAELTLIYELGRDAALAHQLDLARRPEPITASCQEGGRLYLRLSGSEAGLRVAARCLGGLEDPDQGALWAELRDHRHPALRRRPLWRFSLPAGSPYPCEADWLTEWGGSQRWASLEQPTEQLWRIAAQLGGHATAFHGGGAQSFQPLSGSLMRYHQRVKQAFDPHGILNRDRLYPGL